MEAWQAQGAGLPPQQPLDLSIPFRPAALLNAFEQQACRTAGAALGQLQLASCWPGASHAGGKGGFAVQVTGLLLQGALFDGYSLQPVQQVGILSVWQCGHCWMVCPLFCTLVVTSWRPHVCGWICARHCSMRPCTMARCPLLLPPPPSLSSLHCQLLVYPTGSSALWQIFLSHHPPGS
jgi:hypothetical protein